ncbi:dUTP diphosphatase [Clostridium estertheticum]|uniref:dUTP diphosphatase n=1 Tax=Clostridium estertheticum TaxID=238834 RepID=UPI001C0BE095|nr:dUTP diphosphatase [Clostridium estertheticum]MBU3073061.1 dUTP diphosphatase [Clostridium estertheticum]MBU3162902.1 dUTP diphosphatase [Clostridium estertheticum]
MLNVKVKKINELAILPQYAHEGDAGLDLFSVEEKIIMPGETVLVHTGIQIELPKDTEAQIRPRSGLALKNSITVLNTPGTIDEGYRGEIGIILINHGKIDFRVEKNMKIAQMVIKPVLKVSIVEVYELNSTQRGKGGFGSTGL